MNFCEGGIHDCIKIHSTPCEDLKRSIIELVSEGLPLIRALEIYLISPSDFAKMKILAEDGNRELLEFAQLCLKAEASFEISLIRSAVKNPNASAKLLENRFSNTWKNYTESDIEKMNPQELQQFIENQEKKQLMIDITHKAAPDES